MVANWCAQVRTLYRKSIDEVHDAEPKNPQTTHRESAARPKGSPHQDASTLRNYPAEFRWFEVPGSQRQELLGYNDNGRHGRTQIGRICTVRRFHGMHGSMVCQSVLTVVVGRGNNSRTNKLRTSRGLGAHAYTGVMGIILGHFRDPFCIDTVQSSIDPNLMGANARVYLNAKPTPTMLRIRLPLHLP